VNALPVIVRELRAEARHAFTYWLRVLGVGAVLVMAVFFTFQNGLRAESGGELFAYLHGTLHIAIWLTVPLLAADCLSRERREGTLGLLFLTPLTARDITAAKILVHGLRATSLLIAVLPVIILPALMGGVSWRQGLSSLCLNVGAMCLALGAGLLASATSKSWVRSLILAYVLAGIFAFCFCQGLAGLFALALGRGLNSLGLQHGFQLAVGIDPQFFTAVYYYQYGMVFNPAASAAPLFKAILLAAGYTVLLCVLALFFMVLISAVLTARSWQDRPTHPLQIWIQRQLCTPVVMLDLLQRWMKQKLERNPIGWLEQRTWSGRLVIWGWLAVMISLYSLILTDPRFLTRSLGPIHQVMGWMLLVSMAVNASTSFRRERETRVLELLLVSPLSEQQIILGRLRGLWGQFLPSMALLLGGWTYLSMSLDGFGQNVSGMVGLLSSFIAIPVIGLFFSLVCRNFLTALACTGIVGLLVPSLLAAFFHAMFRVLPGVRSYDFTAENLFVIKLGIAAILWSQLHQRLIQRRFATEST